MSLIHNERIKLTANWLNTLSGGCVITGFVAPTIALLLQLQTVASLSPWILGASSLVWLSLGVALHLLGRRMLRRLLP